MALGGELIDPVSFTTIRLVSGALLLSSLIHRRAPAGARRKRAGSWRAGAALFIYAMAFSLAYVSLNTGVGALLLFGAVQVTMMTAALRAGERLGPLQAIGAATAVGGLVYLVLPGLTAPDPVGALLMTVAGLAWGSYSIYGKGVTEPVYMTAQNFLRASPFALLASSIAYASMHVEPAGAMLALLSGSVTSGLGYVLWYKALRDLTTTLASVVQLLVPVLAALGGVAFLSEAVTVRLVAASLLILGGIALTALARSRHVGSVEEKIASRIP
jgi:drug/metabolite transporter (DMT)-like permease